MVINRGTRRSASDFNRSTSSYEWTSDRADGFSEVRFLYDKEGRLAGVDYRLLDSRPDRKKNKEQ